MMWRWCVYDNVPTADPAEQGWECSGNDDSDSWTACQLGFCMYVYAAQQCNAETELAQTQTAGLDICYAGCCKGKGGNRRVNGVDGTRHGGEKERTEAKTRVENGNQGEGETKEAKQPEGTRFDSTGSSVEAAVGSLGGVRRLWDEGAKLPVLSCCKMFCFCLRDGAQRGEDATPGRPFFCSSLFFLGPVQISAQSQKGGVRVRWSAGGEREKRQTKIKWHKTTGALEEKKSWEGVGGGTGALQKWRKYCKVPGWGRVPPPPENTARQWPSPRIQPIEDYDSGRQIEERELKGLCGPTQEQGVATSMPVRTSQHSTAQRWSDREAAGTWRYLEQPTMTAARGLDDEVAGDRVRKGSALA
ncbi:uncharacterized protein Triagg1_4818 [Trichoderma aggressivum f. europaeum]|uniref:Uncharacterized protein n=1 Tax=Trichoderma aggressivum f. europaeum TaxID=173218 RepID=A0AAE1IHG6_9HYPO|nr:hypothetical protein Triagg1_4818 [Trichoderma aggressivum f. europaeum]